MTAPVRRPRTLRGDLRAIASALRRLPDHGLPGWLGPAELRGLAARAGLDRAGLPGRAFLATRSRRLLISPRPATIAAGLAWSVAGLMLFAGYLHAARTSAVTSDGASNALQAWDLLHGNLMLSGWQLSDVSFYTTELPQYALIEWFTGLGPEVVHIASAMTYTLLVLLAAGLARGQATGRERAIRAAIAAGIMLAPQIGNGIFVLIGSPDHTGSTIPVLVLLLFLDRAPRRWFVPVIAGLLLAWALAGDGIVLFTGVLPLALTGLARAYRLRFIQAQPWRQAWFDLSLAAAALAGVWLAVTGLRMISAQGGFVVWPLSNQLLTSGAVPHSALLTSRGLLLLFGANFFGHTAGFVAVLAGLHLVGLALAIWATCAAWRRFGSADRTVQLLAVAIVLTLAGYLFSTRADDLLSARDLAALLPFGAVLAGRLLAGRLTRAKLLPALAIVAVAYLISLGRVVTEPPAPPHSARLAAWLTAHHLSYGLAGYWDANVTTLATGGKIQLLSVLASDGQITGDYWEVRTSWYDPKLRSANFIVLVPPPHGFGRYPTVASVRRTFGQPTQIYYAGQYTIVVWDKNLLTNLARSTWPVPVTPAPSSPVLPLPAPAG